MLTEDIQNFDYETKQELDFFRLIRSEKYYLEIFNAKFSDTNIERRMMIAKKKDFTEQHF